MIDPVTGAQRQIMGGLIFAGVKRRADASRATSRRSRPAPRVGVVYSFNDEDRAARRLGPLLLAVELSRRPARPAGARSATRRRPLVPQATGSVPTVTMSNPFPNGLVQPTGNSLGLLTGAGGDVYFVDPNKGAPRVQQYSVDLQRELPGGMSVSRRLHRPDRQQPELGRIRQRADQHQPARSEVPDARSRDTTQVGAEPVLRRRRRRASSRRRPTCRLGQLLRPYPAVRQRLHAAVDRRALAVPRRASSSSASASPACGAATSATPTAA